MPYLVKNTRITGASSELLVAYRFMSARRIASWPLVPMPYDLLVDCGDSIQRVQVKTGFETGEGIWRVSLQKRNEKGDKSIQMASVDYVCVVCEANHVYVLPVQAIQSPTDPLLVCSKLQLYASGSRFADFLNNFAIGSGIGSGDDGTRSVELTGPALREGLTPWVAKPHRTPRKKHRRLLVTEVNELRRLANSGWSARSLAAKYEVATVTVRNLVTGRRKDLRPRAEELVDQSF